MELLQSLWNICVRCVHKLPCATHTRFPPLIMDVSNAKDQIYSRFLQMCNKMEITDKLRVRYLHLVEWYPQDRSFEQTPRLLEGDSI